MALTRKVYTQGSATINGVNYLAQSVSFKHDQPHESVACFGFSSAARVASGPETSSIEIAFYPTGGEGANINTLAGYSALATPTLINVVTNVAAISGAILTSVAGEGAVGGIPTVTVGFVGVRADSLIASGVTASTGAITNISTSADVTTNTSGCAQKASFNWSIPVQPILCLHGNIATSAEFFGNPPGTASISVEGTTEPGVTQSIDLGNFSINLGGAATTTSSTANLKVGDLFGTFNSTSEAAATACSFGS